MPYWTYLIAIKAYKVIIFLNFNSVKKFVPIINLWSKKEFNPTLTESKSIEGKNQESKRGRNSVGVNEEVCRFICNHFQHLYLSASL